MTTAGDLVTRAREKADLAGTDVYVTDTWMLAEVNSSLAYLYDIITTDYEDYIVTRATASITSGSTFNLPTDFLKVRGVDRFVGGDYQTLYPFSLQERNDWALPSSTLPYYSRNVRYRIEDAYCYIEPAASAVGDYRIIYIPKFSPLLTGGTLPTALDTNAWFEYAAVDVTIKVLQRQELDATQMMAERARQEDRIRNAAKNRDAGPPKAIRDTRRNRGATR